MLELLEPFTVLLFHLSVTFSSLVCCRQPQFPTEMLYRFRKSFKTTSGAFHRIAALLQTVSMEAGAVAEERRSAVVGGCGQRSFQGAGVTWLWKSEVSV